MERTPDLARPPGPASDRRALSLVEVLLAVAVLGVMTVPLVGLFTLGSRASTSGDREVVAAFLAHEVLEKLRVESEAWAAKSDREVPPLRASAKAPEGYTYQIETKPLGDGLLELAVAVRWTEGKTPREVKLATALSRRPGLKSWPVAGRGGSPGFPMPGGGGGWTRR